MQKRVYSIVSNEGLHARPASLLTKIASRYEADVFIEYDGKNVTLKSVIAVMSLGIPKDAEFSIEVDADNAEEVFESLETVLKDNHII